MSIFAGKTLMITGGTGSFGNAVLNRFLKTDIAEIRIFSRDEKKQDDMRHEYQAKYPEFANKIKFFIGDVRNLQSCKNAMPGVECGLCADPTDSFLFTQVNNGNCMSLPYAKGWGWAGEVNLEYLFEKLFVQEPGGGYPESSAKSEQENAARTKKLKTYSHPKFTDMLASIDDEDLIERIKGGFAGKRYELFKEKCKCPEILKAVEAVIL